MILYKCEYCEKTFQRKNDLKRHYNRKNPCFKTEIVTVTKEELEDDAEEVVVVKNHWGSAPVKPPTASGIAAEMKEAEVQTDAITETKKDIIAEPSVSSTDCVEKCVQKCEKTEKTAENPTQPIKRIAKSRYNRKVNMNDVMKNKTLRKKLNIPYKEITIAEIIREENLNPADFKTTIGAEKKVFVVQNT